ncbi:aconitase X [Desulforhopalus singaporensis]|uniref:Predicted aconitase subunit 1 n=1 Tax=Desulforhopalus singaporensis TaxID=91360 RepID=A0A1H0KE33_9BACT|nr:aconitase X catalytic domain-containing protein [Desulforhopalus singaporensis]SDO54070.1 predicted aconitase subunit 1 [Desulforhopalus singaporensis]
MRLTGYEKRMRDGERGAAAAMAMSVIVELAEAVDAPQLVEITHVHTDSGFYLGDAGLEFVEHLVRLGGRVAVPTSMNNTSYDIARGGVYGVPDGLLQKIKRLEQAHLAMGALGSWTCAPYQDNILPGLRENVAWSESNAIVYANSILGARTNRTGDLVDICCALTGRAPKSGLYLEENRKAKYLVDLEGFSGDIFADPRFYPLLGYFIGNRFGNSIVAVSGIPRRAVNLDDLKGFGAAAASSGATALFHLEGITPEAITLDSCLDQSVEVERHAVTLEDIWQSEELLWTAEKDDLDWVGLGCPHFSKAEFRTLLQCVRGKKINGNVFFTVFTSREILKWARREGLVDELREYGIEVYCDGCLLLYPNYLKSSGTMMTNSVKAANYIHSQAGFKAAYGSIGDCVASAVEGRILRSGVPWRM